MSTLRVSRVKTLDDVVWVVFLCCGVIKFHSRSTVRGTPRFLRGCGAPIWRALWQSLLTGKG